MLGAGFLQAFQHANTATLAHPDELYNKNNMEN